ncbi:hypothetical protein KBC79_01385 [Candidatus Woesebacteria bacterium]|nr:hypothetical protein [Candidatus Woesebacteria bacterium]
METDEIKRSPELQMLINNEEEGYNYRERRQPDWLENYTLYRDRVIVNRLIQRQSVNLPIMKQSIRTLLKDVDDMPALFFENLDNDKTAELFKNEYWKITAKDNNMELQDIVDKRQVFLFGRTFDQWQIVDGKIKMTVQDPQDILVSRYSDPTNIDSSRYLIHQHIYVPLSDLKENEDYDKKAVKRLEKFYEDQMGVVKAAENNQSAVEKNQKMSDMGLSDVESPVLGETYVELTMHFVWRANEENEAGEVLPKQIFLYVVAENMEILMKKPLEEVIGETQDHFWREHFPYCSWADDVERQDFWSDSVADVIRPINKLANAWFAQEAERRTLSNFGMHYYDSSMEGFSPSTLQPVPWGWYGIPVGSAGEGKMLKDVIQKVDVPANDGNLESLNFLMGVADRASGASSTQQGAVNERQVTLGEVQLALGEAKERVKGMSKFYTPAWERRGLIFNKLIEAAPEKLDAVKVYKKGKENDKIYPREIAPKDWMTRTGYRVKVWSMEDKNTEDTNTLQKLAYAKSIIQGNPKLDEIHQRKSLEFAGLSPDEINEVMELQQQQMQQMFANSATMNGQPNQVASQPQMQPQMQQPGQMTAAPQL